MSSKQRIRAISVGLGTLSSVLLMSTVFFRWDLRDGIGLSPRFSFSELTRELPHHLWWLVFFILLTALTAFLRAFQWQRTLKVRVPFRLRYNLVTISGLANNVFPGKLGEIIRALLLARSTPLSTVESLGSMAVCKVLELVALVVLACCALAFGVSPSHLHFGKFLKPAVFSCVGLLALVLVLAVFARRLAYDLAKARRAPRLRRFLGQMGKGFDAAKSPGKLLLAFAVSTGPVVAPALAYGVGLQALGMQGGLWAGVLVLAALTLGQTLAAPAAVGAYYFVVAWMARSFGISPGHAAAYAALTHLGTALTQVAMGAFSLPALKLRWGDLRGGEPSSQLALSTFSDAPTPALTSSLSDS